ncbi:MAG TPA: radical SAM protein [Acidimicrobiia bacterium]|nr:radical SAM protein [Acidimicrobiia bacterium]
MAPGLPRELQIEITGACNLRCHMCLVRYRPSIDRVSGTFSADDFRALVDGNATLERLTLQGLGEPLLVPHLVEMIRYASDRGITVGFNTNGTLLTRDRARRLVDAGLSWLHVSLDGATAETYESIRDGARFEKVCANIAGLVEVKRELGSPTPEVQLVFVAMHRNVAELPDLVRLAHRLGVDDVWVQNLSHTFSDTDPAGAYVGIRTFTEGEALWVGRGDDDVFAPARDEADRLGVTLRLPGRGSDPRERPTGEPACDWPWRSAYVAHDGVVQPCCMVMGSDRAEMGRLSEASFDEIWSGDAYRDFRSRLLGDEPPDVCRGCSLYHRTF